MADAAQRAASQKLGACVREVKEQARQARAKSAKARAIGPSRARRAA
jgi:hypothetical protein